MLVSAASCASFGVSLPNWVTKYELVVRQLVTYDREIPFTIVKDGISSDLKEECASLWPALTAPLLNTKSELNAVAACGGSINLSAMSEQTAVKDFLLRNNRSTAVKDFNKIVLLAYTADVMTAMPHGM